MVKTDTLLLMQEYDFFIRQQLFLRISIPIQSEALIQSECNSKKRPSGRFLINEIILLLDDVKKLEYPDNPHQELHRCFALGQPMSRH